jgi:DNA-binding NarL/FixJ family response regulator
MSIAARRGPRRPPTSVEQSTDRIIRVLILDDQLPMRAGIRLALPAEGFEVVAEAATLDDAVEVLAVEAVDILLVGGALDDDMLGAVKVLRDASRESRIVLLASSSAHESSAPVIAAFEAGAVGWLRRDVSPARLPTLLRAVRAGERIVPRSLVGALMGEVVEWRRQSPDVKVFPNGASLTGRELEVLELVAAGAATSHAANQLGISDVTVRRHLSDAVKKLGVADRAAAARLFRTVQHEWVTRPIDAGPARGQPQEKIG